MTSGSRAERGPPTRRHRGGRSLAGSALAHPARPRGRRGHALRRRQSPRLARGRIPVPAVVPILRALGLEDETARVQPDQTRRILRLVGRRSRQHHVQSLRAGRLSRTPTTFPVRASTRPLLAKAPASGVRHVRRPGAARAVARDPAPSPADVSLPRRSPRPPALAERLPASLIDATGRARYGARVLGIPAPGSGHARTWRTSRTSRAASGTSRPARC